jgi:hypothetical protein
MAITLTAVAPPERISTPHAALISEFYSCFNERRFADAAAMFAETALVEHSALQRTLQGGEGYRAFAEMWCQGFPDATVVVERVVARAEGMYEVELIARGTHLGDLDLGGGWAFRATGAVAELRLRQLLQVEAAQFSYSTLSFDLQDIVQQLVTVDEKRLIELTRRIHKLGQTLAGAASFLDRRNALQRLGIELDEARHVLRPYYKR